MSSFFHCYHTGYQFGIDIIKTLKKILIFQGYAKGNFRFLKSFVRSAAIPNYQSKMNQIFENYKAYRIIRTIGTGTFATVSLMMKIDDGSLYALKSIQTSRMNEKQIEYALNEVRLLSSIRIPNVITYESAFFNQLTGELGIVMEYAEGGDLEVFIGDIQKKIQTSFESHNYSGLEEEFVWKVAFDILKGLKKLHENKIIHRDIKTANIFFVNGVAKLGDLNVSRVIQQEMCSTLTGTPYYMSPEIWKGEKYDEKCDIWSLGCVLYEMCTFSPPFKAKDFPTLYNKVLTGKYEEISNAYSDKIKRFIEKCLNPDPFFRPNAKSLLELSFMKNSEPLGNEGVIRLTSPIKYPRKLNYMTKKMETEVVAEKPAKKNVRFGNVTQEYQEEDFVQKSRGKKLFHRKVLSMGSRNYEQELPAIRLKLSEKKNFRVKTENSIKNSEKHEDSLMKVFKDNIPHENIIMKPKSNSHKSKVRIRTKSYKKS